MNAFSFLHGCCNSCYRYYSTCCFMCWMSARCYNTMKYYTMWYLLCMQVWLSVYLFLELYMWIFGRRTLPYFCAVIYRGAAEPMQPCKESILSSREERRHSWRFQQTSVPLKYFFSKAPWRVSIHISLCMLREAMGIIYVVQEEREIKEKRDKERVKESGRERERRVWRHSHQTSSQITLGQKPERYVLN